MRQNNNGASQRILTLERRIQELERLLEERRESSSGGDEQLHRHLFENMDDPIQVFDKEGVFLFLNDAAARNLGGTPEEFVGKTLRDLFADKADVYLKRIGKVIETGERIELVDSATFPSGLRWFRACLKPLRDREGNIYAAQTISRDITEQRAAEKALRDSEGNYRLLIDTFADSIQLYDIEGRFLFINIVGARFLDGVPGDFVGKTLYDIQPRESANFFIQRHRQVIESGQGAEFEDCVDMPSGKMWFWSHLQPVRNSRGETFGVQVISYDITKRKHAEQELGQLRNLLSNIINSMPSVLVGVGEDGRVTHWNRAAEKATGISSTEAQGRSLAQVFPQLEGELEKVEEAIRSREIRKDEKVVQRTEDETLYSDVTIYPLVANGVDGAVIRIDDVTERVRIEEMIIQSEKMLSVGGLAAGMAHEINNPLAGIMQNAQVIRQRLSNKLEANQETAREVGLSFDLMTSYLERRNIHQLLEAVMNSGKRAARVVDNMLDFSRKSDAATNPHNIAELLDRTVELASNDYDLKKKYDFRRIKIVREYDPQTPTTYCEGSKIQQVFLNILKNGAQAFLEWGGRRESPRFVLRVFPDDQMVRIEIEDNGPGMDDVTRRRVFEPFFTTKETGDGTGLGLSLSYFIVTENHRGEMAVESSLGEGTRFVIKLPFTR